MKNKIYIGLGIILFGVVTSYIAFGWTEPTSMPSDYDVPINTSNKPQDVAEGKPVVRNLDAEKLGGYTASDILNLIGGGVADYQIVEGTTCPAGTILTSKYYEEKTCTYDYSVCWDGVTWCSPSTIPKSLSTDSSNWGTDPSTSIRYCSGVNCRRLGPDLCEDNPQFSTFTCQADVTHVLCLTISDP